jgi:hypothetical protein
MPQPLYAWGKSPRAGLNDMEKQMDLMKGLSLLEDEESHMSEVFQSMS